MSESACSRNRDGCDEQGPWRPFYQAFVCESCLRLDAADVQAGKAPPGLFQAGRNGS